MTLGEMFQMMQLLSNRRSQWFLVKTICHCRKNFSSFMNMLWVWKIHQAKISKVRSINGYLGTNRSTVIENQSIIGIIPETTSSWWNPLLESNAKKPRNWPAINPLTKLDKPRTRNRFVSGFMAGQFLGFFAFDSNKGFHHDEVVSGIISVFLLLGIRVARVQAYGRSILRVRDSSNL